MLNLYALRARAGARSKTAQNTDRVQRARPGRPVVLRDGSHVLIRQVQPADAALLADGFARLSIQSRWLRAERRGPSDASAPRGCERALSGACGPSGAL
jgi:hypothetical protein